MGGVCHEGESVEVSDGDRYVRGTLKFRQDWGDPEQIVIALPHQCQEWTIGSREDVTALIEDLIILLEQL